MIKTEIEAHEDDVVNEAVETESGTLASVAAASPAWPIGLGAVLLIIAAGLGSYLLYNHSSTAQPIPQARNIGNVPALQLVTNPSSSNQASSTTGALNASSINLQNNVPSGQGSPKTNSLQSTGNSLSTGQSVNSNLPF